MRSGVLIEPRKIEVRQIPVPLPGAGEVLVRIKTALTCGTDLKTFLRGHPLIPLPSPLGHEFSGIVAETGRDVAHFRPGDEVMAVHSAPCLSCRYCVRGFHNLCEHIMETKVLGAFAEYILLPQHIVQQNLFLKPYGISFDTAAFLEPLSCVVHGMRGLMFRQDETALVIGAGAIGLLHLLALKQKGVRVIVTGLEQERLHIARTVGADAVAGPEGITSAVNSFTGGTGVDYVFECTGQPMVWEAAVQYVRRGGTVVLFGGCPPGTTVTYDTTRLHYDEITVRGVFHYTPADVKTAAEFLARLPSVSQLISGRFALDNLAEAFERLSRGEGIKYAITP